jgi:enoyl-CoA hydratase
LRAGLGRGLKYKWCLILVFGSDRGHAVRGENTVMQDIVIKSMPKAMVMQLSLNRPHQRNALSNEMIARLARVLEEEWDSDEVRCCVLVGADNFFSAGADIKEMEADGITAINNVERIKNWRIIEQYPKPIIAAVEGYAFGGGHELALVADIIVAAEDAWFGQPEINLGILPGDGATQRLTRVAGKSLAMQMMLSGDPITAQMAHAAGLVSCLVPHGDALEKAINLAAGIALKSPIAARLVKTAIKSAYDTSLSAGLEVERQAIQQAFAEGSHVEPMRRFLHKKEPTKS